MDAQQFLTQFSHIANAPGGVAQLRQMIYQSAVTGALTPRNNDEDAGALLENVELTRQSLIREQRYKRLLDLESEPIRPPHGIALPQSWRWTRLLDIGEINPRNDAPDDQLAAFVPMSGVPQLHRGTVEAQTKKWEEIKRGYTHFRNGDVVLAKITPCFENGKAAVVANLPGDSGIGTGTTELQVYRPIHAGILPEYVYLFLRSPLFVVEGEKNMTGTAGQKRLPTDYFATRALPLPPTEEQTRVVSKVDELMALCDKLERQQQSRCELQYGLRMSTLQAITFAPGPNELQRSWSRFQRCFEYLFSASADVLELKGLVLDLAASGRLLSLDGKGQSSGADLLDKISSARLEWASSSEGQEHKEAAAMLKKLRTQRPKPPSAALPEHWAWGSLIQVAQAVVDCHNKTAPYVSNGIPLVRTTDIRDGQMNLSNTKKISEETYAHWARRMSPKSGDIFLTREAPMGEAAIVPDGERVCLGQRVMLIRLFPGLFNNRFLLYVIQSPGFQSRMIEAAIGMTVKHLRVGGVEDLMVPVPPRSEQDQIVSVVDRLFALCDQYADRLRKQQKYAGKLATASVASLSGIATAKEEDEPVKVPETELIANVHLGRVPDAKSQAPLASLLVHHNGEMNAKDLWQRFGGEIDAFYAQLKTEVAHGWIQEPAAAEVREEFAEGADA